MTAKILRKRRVKACTQRALRLLDKATRKK